jgi:hypothetical protein
MTHTLAYRQMVLCAWMATGAMACWTFVTIMELAFIADLPVEQELCKIITVY